MEIKQIPLSLVATSPMNPRKTFEEDALKELSENIEKQGLLQPITVRPIKPENKFNFPSTSYADGMKLPEYEIICGERRYRAVCKLSEKWRDMDCVAHSGQTNDKFTSIAAIVRDMNDEEAFDAMITENLQRKDVDPMEEAFAFGKLAEKGKTPEEIAARFGKSIRFITDRIKLNSLIPELMLAVKEEKMPIVSASIICKLNPDSQRKYYKSYNNAYNGYSKQNAQSFVNNLFMTLDNAIWYGTDNQADEDFEDGCGCACKDCQFNTINHGCLFYEMKTEGTGRCTDRTKFQSKSEAFMLHEVERHADELVKSGESLERGKMVVAFDANAEYDASSKEMSQRLRDAIAQKGYLIADPANTFKSRCWYDADDKRVIEGIENGTIYRVLLLFKYTSPAVNEIFYWAKEEEEINTPTLPEEVSNLLSKIKRENELFPSAKATKGAKILAELSSYSDEEMPEDVEVLMYSIMLCNNLNLIKALIKSPNHADPDVIRKYVSEHREQWRTIMIGWICQQLNESHRALRMGEDLLDALGKFLCPEQWENEMSKLTAKHNKEITKSVMRLQHLGYDAEGNKIADKVSEAEYERIYNAYQEMKSKHGDSALLFKIGDNYCIFKDDADAVASILELDVFPMNGALGKMCSFPVVDIDSNLPKLVRAGRRVAICEQLEKP